MREINLYYYKKGNNFGDILNEYIPEKLFNCKIVRQDIYKADAAFIGSILSHFLSWDNIDPNNLPVLNVWGSGLIRNTPMNKKLIRNLKVYALRGKYTKELLEKYCNTIYDVPLGDPGLLCSRVYTNFIKSKQYDYGIIPHYMDKYNANLKKLKLKNSIILDITECPEKFLAKLVKCKKVISSAMHGLIAADSFHIPNIRMILSNDIVGGDFKYNDYYSAFGIENHDRIDLRTIKEPITQLDFSYKITKKQIDQIQNDLIRSFPYA